MAQDVLSFFFESRLENGEVEHEFRPDEFLLDQATARYIDKVEDIPITEETVTFGDIATKGYCILYNLDSTNYINFGFTTGQLQGKVNAGEFAAFRMENAGSLILQANGGTVKVKIILYEN